MKHRKKVADTFLSRLINKDFSKCKRSFNITYFNNKDQIETPEFSIISLSSFAMSRAVSSES